MRFRPPAILLLATVVFGGCKPKPISEVPSLSKSRGPDTTDRELPGGKTIAAALPLLDPRSGDFDELVRRRHEFQAKLEALVPDAATRQSFGFDSLLRWHELYARRKQALDNAITALRSGTASVLAPGPGYETRIDSIGQAKICPAPPAEPTEIVEGAPVAPKPDGDCRRVAGYRQLESDFGNIDAAVADVLEAQWFVLTTLKALEARLDPMAAAAPVQTAER